jgi:DNA-binding NtrC family response regulator
VAHILVVDDEDSLRDLVKTVVSQMGHRATTACDGQEAFNYIKNNDFDLVITDMIMPKTSGIELIHAVRKSHPDLPFLAISAGGDIAAQDYLQRASELGAVHTLQKPFDYEDLARLVAQVLQR